MYAEPTHVVANTCRADYAEPLHAEPLFAEPMYVLHHCASIIVPSIVVPSIVAPSYYPTTTVYLRDAAPFSATTERVVEGANREASRHVVSVMLSKAPTVRRHVMS